MLIFTNIGFRVRHVEICAVQYSNEFYLPMTRIAFSGSETIRNVQCSHEWTYLLILRNRVLRLGNVHIWAVPPYYVVDLIFLRNRFFRLRNVQIWVGQS